MFQRTTWTSEYPLELSSGGGGGVKGLIVTRCPMFVPRYNQVNAISLACKTGLKECQDLASSWFRAWMTSGTNR